MESTSSTKHDSDQKDILPSFEPAMCQIDLTALLEENKQLRELVIQLSKIVIRNVAG